MSDLTFSFSFPGVEDGERAVKMLGGLQATLEAGKGSGKSLEELRKILVGMKGAGSVLEELKNSVQSLNLASDTLKSGFTRDIGSLAKIIQTEFKNLSAQLRTSGLQAGKELAGGMVEGLDNTETAVVKKFRNISAKAKAEATKMYQDLVSQQPNAKIKDVGALFQLEEAGATLSPYHKQVLANWKKSSAETLRAIRANEKATAAELEGIVKTEEAELQAALQNMEARSKLRNSSLAGIYADSLARGKGNIARVKSALKTEADEIIATQKTESERLQKMMATAMNNAGGYQRYNPTTGLKGELVNVKPQVDELDKSMKKLTITGNDMHSMARGLASGFGLLWLTWGNLIPLFAGAAISNSFMQTVKTGMEVAHTLEIIGSLGGATAGEVKALSDEMIRLGTTGPFGPREIASAMQVLTLAGLKANEVLAVTSDVLNFSVAGTTDLKMAAETLVSITTAFGMGAGGFAQAGDIVVRAAADSKASVESFGEALKTASVAGEQFGAKLSDVAVQVEVLAQLGIQGSAAGTSIRNFYTDISGRTPKVVNAIKALGIEFRDTATGSVKPLIENVKQLSDAMNTLTPVGGKNWLATVFSERGGKDAVALIVEYKKQIKDTNGNLLAWSETNNALAQRLRDVENAAGDAAIAAAKMGTTADSEFKKVAATLQTSMFSAFKSVEPQLLIIFDLMQRAFASPEFIAVLSALTRGIATLGEVVIENGTYLATAAGIYVTAKLAMAGLTAATALNEKFLRSSIGIWAQQTGMVTANTAVLEANTAAKAKNSAADAMGTGTAMGKIGLMSKLASANMILNGILVVGTAAWIAYDFVTKKSSDTDQEAADLRSGKVIQSLQAEIDKIDALNAKRATGLSFTEAQLALDREKAGADVAAEGGPQLRQVIKDLSDAQGALDRYDAAQKRVASGSLKLTDLSSAGVGGARRAQLETTVNNLLNERNGLLRKEGEARAFAVKKTEELQAKTRAQNEARAKESAENAKKVAAETQAIFSATGKPFQQQDFGGGGRPAFQGYVEGLKVAADNSLKLVSDWMTRQNQLIDAGAAADKAILDARHSAGLISEGQYQAEIFKQIKQSEDDKLKVIEDGNDAYKAAYVDRVSEINKALNIAVGKGMTDAVSKLSKDLENLARDYRSFMEGNETAQAKAKAENLARMEVASIKAQGAIKKLEESEREYWKKDADEITKLKTLDEVSKRYKSINTSVFSLDTATKAAAEAGATATETFNAKLADMDFAYKKAESAALDFMQTNIMALVRGDAAATKAYDSLLRIIEEMKKAREEAKEKAGKSIEDRSMLAFEKARQAQIDAFATEIGGAFESAIFEGGKAGSAKFVAILRRELLTKPLQAFISGTISELTGGSSARGGGGGTGGFGGIGNILGLFGDASSGTISSLLGSSGMGTLDIGGFSFGGLSSALSPLLDFIPYIGWALTAANAVKALLKKFDTSGTPHVGSMAEYSVEGGLSTSQKHGAFGMGFGGVDANKEIKSMVSELSKGAVGILDSISKAFGGKGGYSVATGFADDSSKDGAWGGLVIKKLGETLVNWDTSRTSKWAPREFANGEEGVTQYLAAVAKDVLGVIKEMDLPKWADEFLDTLGENASLEDIAKVVDTINATKAALATMGKNLVGFASYSDDAASALIRASGGIESLATNASTYYDLYYSEQEKLANATRDVTAALAEHNIALPTSREEYRKLVEQYTAMGEEGAGVLAVLLGLAGAFAAITPDAENVISVLEKKNKLDELNIALLRAQGKETEAVALERARELLALEAYGKEAQEIQKRIWELIDAAAVKTKRDELDIALLRAMGKESEAVALERERELAALYALDPALADTQKRIWDLTDAAAIKSKQDDLDLALLRAMGKDSEALALERERELAALYALDPALAATQKRIYELTDAAAIKSKQDDLDLALLRAMGKNSEALALERERELAALYALDPALADTQKRIWDLTDATQALSDAGIDAQNLGTIIRDGMLGRISKDDLGTKMSDMIVNGIYNAMANTLANQISKMFIDTVVSPMITAVTTGGAISTVISQAAIDSVVANAVRAAEVIAALVNDPAFLAAIDAIRAAIGGITDAIAGAGGAYIDAGNDYRDTSDSIVDATNNVKDAWQSISDSLIEEIKRIRGELAGDGMGGYAYAQSEFALATAKARAGDQEAAKMLPQLSQNLLQLAETNAKSLVELRRMQAQTAASLVATNDTLVKKYGLDVPAFAAGGNHLGGWALVGEQGPELAYMPPARVYNTQQSASMLNNSNDVIEEGFERLGYILESIAGHTSKSTRILERGEVQGFPVRTIPGQPIETV